VHNNQTYEKHKGRSLTRLSIRQLQAGLMSQSWNELLRYWRSGYYLFCLWGSSVTLRYGTGFQCL